MNPLDKIIAQSIETTLKEDLGERTFNKVESLLQEHFGLSVEEAVNDFTKIDFVLRKLFKNLTIKIERKIFKKILTIKHPDGTIIINDIILTKRILESYADPVKSIILESLMNNPNSIPEAIAKCDAPQSSAYRKTKELIKDGLLTMVGYTTASDDRKVSQFETSINRTKIDIHDKGIILEIQLKKNFLKNSYAFNSLVNT